MAKQYFVPRAAREQQPKSVFSISQLNTRVQQLFDAELPSVWVTGEISNFTHHGSGHMYFTLKDENAQVSAAMFKGNNQRLRFTPKQGMQVVAHAKISLYSPRGSYQLVIQSMQPAGEGNLQQRFDQLKAKLYEAGLFAAENKRTLPAFAYTVGIITSPTGAVIQDIRNVLKRRAPWVNLIVFPAKVQGDDAKTQLVSALAKAQQEVYGCDVLILARGGGSLEDLWPFNEEVVAHAIADCQLPLISAVGHETDTTIADFVADVRAPTPSAAAELVAMEHAELLAQFTHRTTRLEQHVSMQVARACETLGHLRMRLKSPETVLQEKAQRIDEYSDRLHWLMRNKLHQSQQRLAHSQHALSTQRPDKRLAQQKTSLHHLTQKLHDAWKHQLQYQHNQLRLLSVSLHNLSPLATLSRGYSVTRDTNDRIIESVTQVSIGQTLQTHLGNGRITSTVTDITPQPTADD